MPPRLGWCCLRCLVRRGISIESALRPGSRRRTLGRRGAVGTGGAGRAGRPGRAGPLATTAVRATALAAATAVGTAAVAATATVAAVAAVRTPAAVTPTTTRCRRASRSLRLSLGAGAGHLTAVDPHLDADPAEGRTRLVEAVVDVGPQRVQRDPALAVELRARHLRAAEPTRALDPDALGTGPHRGLHRLAHRATELHAARQLLGHALRNQLGVQLGVLDLEDVELHLLAGELLEVAAQSLGLGAAPADHDARPGGVDVHSHPVAGALDLDPGDARAVHALGEHLADRHVLTDVGLVELVGVPPALVIGGDAETEPVRVDLLSH